MIFFQRFSKSTTPLFNEGLLTGGNGGLPGRRDIPSRSATVLGNPGPHLQRPLPSGQVARQPESDSELRSAVGVRNWPSGVLNTQWKNFDPRVGLAYILGTSHNVVFRAGFGLFHGIIPSPLLMCQAPSCGGQSPYPNRPFENGLNANTGLFSFASAPIINYLAFAGLLGSGPAPVTGQPPIQTERPSLRSWAVAQPGFLRLPAGCDHRTLRPE